MKKITKLTLLVVFIILFSTEIFAQTEYPLYFFYGDGCPHCAKEEVFLDELQEEYPDLQIKRYEVWYNRTNALKMQQAAEQLDFEPRGVPTTIFYDSYWIGYSEKTGEEIRARIEKCYNVGCFEETQPTEDDVVDLPILGEIDASETGLVVFTIILGTLDGFNACAMWVLMFLLSLLIYTKSRKKIFMIGGTFIFVSGVVYFLFMAAWMNAFLFAGHLKFIQAAIAVVAIVFGLINIKDFFFMGKGISLTIPDDKKPTIVKKMKSLIHSEEGILLTLVGVASLAFMVNLVELLCTSGFPAIYTNILSMYDLPSYQYYLYLLLYIVMYMIDDFIIFSIVVTTMSSKRFTEKYGRLSKLISGVIILLLGLIMLIRPQLLMFG